MPNSYATYSAIGLFMIFCIVIIVVSLISSAYGYYRYKSSSTVTNTSDTLTDPNYDPNAVLEDVKPGEIPNEDKPNEDKPNENNSTQDKVVVILYSRTKYENPIAKLYARKYSFDDKMGLKSLNDRVESIKIADGYEAYLYKNTNYDNSFGKITKSIPDLKNYANELSSIAIVKAK